MTVKVREMKGRQMVALRSASASLYWSAVLGLSVVLGSYGLACVFPFAAFAALAAVTLPTRQGLILVGAAWAVNQLIGFTLLDYASGANAVTWVPVIGAGALLAFGAARFAAGRDVRRPALRAVTALAAAIVTYQGVMFLGAYALDGFASSTPEIVRTIVLNDMVWFAGLAAMHAALTAALPRWFGTTTALRAA